MKQSSLRPVSRTVVAAAVTLGYLHNYTPQTLVTSLPAEHIALFAADWRSTTASDAGVQAQYRLNAAPVQIDTCLLRLADAAPEAARQLALAKVPHTVYEFDGEPEMLLLELAQPVTITNHRFGMSAGVPGVSVSLAPDWLNARVTVGVMV